MNSKRKLVAAAIVAALGSGVLIAPAGLATLGAQTRAAQVGPQSRLASSDTIPIKIGDPIIIKDKKPKK